MSTTTNLTTLKINYLTQAQYNTALVNDEINENEIYMTPASSEAAIAQSVNYTTTIPTAANLSGLKFV